MTMKMNVKYMLTHDPKHWTKGWIQTLVVLWNKFAVAMKAMEAMEAQETESDEN